MESPAIPGRFMDLWGPSVSDLFAVGFSGVPDGEIYHYDGNAWTLIKHISATTASAGRASDVAGPAFAE
jgi:hypothetical protein